MKFKTLKEFTGSGSIAGGGSSDPMKSTKADGTRGIDEFPGGLMKKKGKGKRIPKRGEMLKRRVMPKPISVK